MTTATVQLPDDLYERARRFSEEHHLSLEETMQRALELLLEPEPPPAEAAKPWKLPTFDGGGILVPLEQLRDITFEEEANRSLPHD
jgi:hypothetical protein